MDIKKCVDGRLDSWLARVPHAETLETLTMLDTVGSGSGVDQSRIATEISSRLFQAYAVAKPHADVAFTVRLGPVGQDIMQAISGNFPNTGA